MTPLSLQTYCYPTPTNSNQPRLPKVHACIKVLTVDCTEQIEAWINEIHPDWESLRGNLPISGYSQRIDLVVVGTRCEAPTELAIAISDWPSAPPAVFVSNPQDFESREERFRFTPGIGRNILHCETEQRAFSETLAEALTICKKRKEMGLTKTGNDSPVNENISPSWLFEILLQDLPEYIYFKDTAGRFLALSSYTALRSGLENPSEAIGLTDYDLFDPEHADEAHQDEEDLISGRKERVEKEEFVTWKGNKIWVQTLKLPIRSLSGFPLGTFGVSRDITLKKQMGEQLATQHKRLKDELDLARSLQSSLITKGIPDFKDKAGHDRLHFAAKHIASSQLSGDFYAVLKTPSGNAAVFLADVTGHGARAAMVTAMLHAAVNEAVGSIEDPAKFMLEINKMMYAWLAEKGHFIFVSGALCYIDFDARVCRCCQNGGEHVLVWNREAGNQKSEAKIPVNPAIGLLQQTTFANTEIPISDSDEVLLFTDGIIEAGNANEEEFGMERLTAFLKEDKYSAATEHLDKLIHELEAFTGKAHHEDDICILALRLC